MWLVELKCQVAVSSRSCMHFGCAIGCILHAPQPLWCPIAYITRTPRRLGAQSNVFYVFRGAWGAQLRIFYGLGHPIAQLRVVHVLRGAWGAQLRVFYMLCSTWGAQLLVLLTSARYARRSRFLTPVFPVLVFIPLAM